MQILKKIFSKAKAEEIRLEITKYDVNEMKDSDQKHQNKVHKDLEKKLEVKDRSVVMVYEKRFIGKFKKLGNTHQKCPYCHYDPIVNTTSAGLSDENYPAPLEILRPLLEKSSFAADAIYGKVTPFLKLCKDLNITYKDGADMLLGQGVLANNYFTKGRYTLEEIKEEMKKSFSF